MCFFISCDIDIIRTDDNRNDIVYKNKKESKDDFIVYNYILGNKFCEIKKEKQYGNEVKKSVTYHRNGKVMSYRLHNKDKLLYYRIYDKSGVSIKYDGCGILFQDSINYSTLEYGNEYMRSLDVVNPPNCKVVIMIGEYRSEKLRDRDLKKYPVRMYDVYNSNVNYRVKTDSLGILRYQIYWAVEDTVSNDIQKGKVIQQYNVIRP